MGGWLYHWVYLDLYLPLWPNIAADAAVAFWVTLKFRAMGKLHDELRDLHVRHHAEHMDALNLQTPGGLAAVAAEARDAKTAAESAHAGLKALASARPSPAPPWRRT